MDPACDHDSPSLRESTSSISLDRQQQTSSPVVDKSHEMQDLRVVVRAARYLKPMLADLMALLEKEAKAQVFIQGEITLRVKGREEYRISLFNPEGTEPSDLKVRIDKASGLPTGPKFPNGLSNETASRKRLRNESSLDDLTEDSQPAMKREKLGSGEHVGETPVITSDNKRGGLASSPSMIVSTLQNMSAQIKWVEECRRIADKAHDRREETWRSTSASFHDDMRKARERHDAFMMSETAWQRNILVGIMNGIKGLYPRGSSLKWETSQQGPQRSTTTMSMDGQRFYQAPTDRAGRRATKDVPVTSNDPANKDDTQKEEE